MTIKRKIKRRSYESLQSLEQPVEKTLYVFATIFPWNALALTNQPPGTGTPLRLQGSASQGFLLVYDSLESLQYDKGKDAEYFTLSTQQKV